MAAAAEGAARLTGRYIPAATPTVTGGAIAVAVDAIHSPRTDEMRESTVAATLAIDMLRYLERRGHSAAAIAATAGFAPDVLQRPDDRIEASRMAALWEAAVSATGDPLVAVHMAAEFHPAALDILGYVVLTCRTVGDVLERLARYAGLLNDGMRVTVTRAGARVVLRLAFQDPGTDNGAPASRYVAESMWIGLARQLRGLAVEPVTPLEVAFRHRVDDPTEHARLLGAPVRFGAEEDRFVLAATDLARPLPSANAALLSVFEQHAALVLARLSAADDLVSRVARVITTRLKGRAPAIGEVASELAMSSRTLQRALQAEGQGYQQVLDSVRRELAHRYLSDERHSVSQVAFLLGFSEAAAFHRAFKRWTGTTPAQARARDA